MALKKDVNSVDSEQGKSQNKDNSLLELKNLENKNTINILYLHFKSQG